MVVIVNIGKWSGNKIALILVSIEITKLYTVLRQFLETPVKYNSPRTTIARKYVSYVNIIIRVCVISIDD